MLFLSPFLHSFFFFLFLSFLSPCKSSFHENFHQTISFVFCLSLVLFSWKISDYVVHISFEQNSGHVFKTSSERQGALMLVALPCWSLPMYYLFMYPFPTRVLLFFSLSGCMLSGHVNPASLLVTFTVDFAHHFNLCSDIFNNCPVVCFLL